MKRVIILSLTIVMAAATVSFAYTTPLHKLSAGIKQVVTGPFSILTVTNEQLSQESNKMLGFVGGLMEGAVQSAVKPVEGLFKILTFPWVDPTHEE